MKYSLLFLSLCAMLCACSDGGGDELDIPVGEQGSSSSALLSSSSSAPFIPPCKITVLEKDLWQGWLERDTTKLYFDAQGGMDSSLTTTPDIMEILRPSNPEEDEKGCEYFSIGDDYCENNYCYESDFVRCNDQGCYPSPFRMKKECPWYSVTITGVNSLLVSVDKNETGEERVSQYIRIGLNTGCASIDVQFSITQSAE